MKNRNYEVVFLDNDRNKQNNECIYGIKCISPSSTDISCSHIICVKKTENRENIVVQLERMGCRDIYFTTADFESEVGKLLDDESYIRCLWYEYMKYDIDLDKPITFVKNFNG